jgi:hypothetical protein
VAFYKLDGKANPANSLTKYTVLQEWLRDMAYISNSGEDAAQPSNIWPDGVASPLVAEVRGHLLSHVAFALEYDNSTASILDWLWAEGSAE